MMEIDEGALKWKVINTRNVDNVQIEVDASDERNRHDEQICNYLIDKKAYWSYFDSVCEKLGYGQLLTIVDRTVHPHHNKATILSLLKMWVRRNSVEQTANDQTLIRLLSHDCNRMLLNWSLKRHIFKKK